MKYKRLALLLAAICLALSGCSSNDEVENQAYALILGIDQTDDGGIALTIRIPRIGQSPNGQSQSETEDDPYLVITASGADYAHALEQLQWTLARELNLSQLKLVIVSKALASESAFRALVSRIAETRHLYTTASFVVCEGRAFDFVSGQDTLIGTRLSSEITAMLNHYALHGYIPKSTFADLYCATRAPYSDATGILAVTSQDPSAHREDRAASAAVTPRSDILAMNEDDAPAQSYLGAAIFRDGVLACTLDAAETLCLNLVSDKVKAFTFESGGRAYTLSSLSRPRHRVSFDGSQPHIDVNLSLSSEERLDPIQLSQVRDGLTNDIKALLSKCQALSVEPFGFSLKAASRFATLASWTAFDWHSRFSEANVAIHISIANPSA